MTNVPLAGTDIDELRTSYQTNTWPQFVGLDLFALHVYTCTTIPTSVMVTVPDVAFVYVCDIWKYAELPLATTFDAVEIEPYNSCPVPEPLAIGAASLVALNGFDCWPLPTCIIARYAGGV